MYQNDIFFYYFKLIFEISVSKWFKTYKKILILAKTIEFFKKHRFARVFKCILNLKSINIIHEYLICSYVLLKYNQNNTNKKGSIN